MFVFDNAKKTHKHLASSSHTLPVTGVRLQFLRQSSSVIFSRSTEDKDHNKTTSCHDIYSRFSIFQQNGMWGCWVKLGIPFGKQNFHDTCRRRHFFVCVCENAVILSFSCTIPGLWPFKFNYNSREKKTNNSRRDRFLFAKMTRTFFTIYHHRCVAR